MPIEFAAIIAIDWADQKHAWAMQAGNIKSRDRHHRPYTGGD
jgi:hypothetical protein